MAQVGLATAQIDTISRQLDTIRIKQKMHSKVCVKALTGFLSTLKRVSELAQAGSGLDR